MYEVRLGVQGYLDIKKKVYQITGDIGNINRQSFISSVKMYSFMPRQCMSFSLNEQVRSL